jgi:hypothetical protein
MTMNGGTALRRESERMRGATSNGSLPCMTPLTNSSP